MSTDTIDSCWRGRPFCWPVSWRYPPSSPGLAFLALRSRFGLAGESGLPPFAEKAEVIAMMKRAKGATLPEIMKATGWQPHTVRGFVSILGSKGGEKIESSKNAAGERTYKIGK
jgi:hypothetical protein